MAAIRSGGKAATAAAPKNNTATLTSKLSTEVNAAQNAKAAMAKQFREQEKVRVQISPFYRPYFGNNMPIILNGIAVYIPCDGKMYEIPRAFADIVGERIGRVDRLIQKQGVMGGIIEESYAGENELLNEA